MAWGYRRFFLPPGRRLAALDRRGCWRGPDREAPGLPLRALERPAGTGSPRPPPPGGPAASGSSAAPPTASRGPPIPPVARAPPHAAGGAPGPAPGGARLG